ncbi:MAG: TGS domain-containing protein [Bacillota bacterium]|nr:TGS domain-containing protein [Bacillota bacterium]
MPANLTPDYHAAERRFREAETPDAKLAALHEMMATIPKHKGTEKMQGDIKRRIAKLKQASERKSGAARQKPFWHVEREGAGQIVLLGPPNSGKSAILRELSRAEPEVADFPFTTRVPLPGMVSYENVQIQLLDLPPLAPGRTPPWIRGLVKAADAVLVVLDLGSDELLDQTEGLLAEIDGYRVDLYPVQGGPEVPQAIVTATGQVSAPATEAAPAAEAGAARRQVLAQDEDEVRAEDEDEDEDDAGAAPRALKPAAVVGAKCDDADAVFRLELLRESLAGSPLLRLPLVEVSTLDGRGLDKLRRRMFELLEIIRVYTRAPGKKPDFETPFVLPRGSTVIEAASQVHKDFARDLKFARVWGAKVFDGQMVPRDHILQDGDVIEFHV